MEIDKGPFTLGRGEDNRLSYPLPREQVERLLEPSFEIASGRVAARTGSLFSARQIVKAQGGEIQPFSEPSGETGFLVYPAGSGGLIPTVTRPRRCRFEACPRGRQIQYALVPGEAGWLLRVDKVVES